MKRSALFGYLLLACAETPARVPPPAAPQLPPSVGVTPVASTAAPIAADAPPAPALVLPADSWKSHVIEQLMPFWTMPSALGKTAASPFPTYRCRDGLAYGDTGCDFADIKNVNFKARHPEKKTDVPKDGPFEWITGPRNELLGRSYIRMHSRQTYAYGVAYHLTGNPEYLKLAHRGVDWLIANAIDKKNGGSFTFVEKGKFGPDFKLRTSQDQSYTLLGLAFYYYLTRDPDILKILTDLKTDILRIYRVTDRKDEGLLKWMLESKQEPKATCLSTIPAPDKGTIAQKELVALLDQVNAYMLLVTQSTPADARAGWLNDLHTLAQTIRDRFYNDGQKGKDQTHTGVSPIVPPGMFAGCLTYGGPPQPKYLPKKVPACSTLDDPTPNDPENCDPSAHHTDFGHSIKSFWMLYLIGREANDTRMMEFGVTGADALFKRAYSMADGTWARAYALQPDRPYEEGTTKIDTNKEWWIYAELDQMAATLALREPAPHVRYLNTTYRYWLDHFVTNAAEVVQWRCDPDDGHCQNDLIPKANLWKNAFHSTEHGLVAYVTTAGVNHAPATLYFAPVAKDTIPQLQPYYFRASKTATNREGTIEDRGVVYQKVRAEFSDIK